MTDDSTDQMAEVVETLRITEERLASIDQALRALDAGSYGLCESCGKPIPDDVLMKDATARRCGC